MSCQNTLGFFMQTDEIADSLIGYFERVEAGRCKACQSPAELANLIEQSNVPNGLGMMYLNWVGEER